MTNEQMTNGNYLPERFADNVAQAVSLHTGLAACATGGVPSPTTVMAFAQSPLVGSYDQ